MCSLPGALGMCALRPGRHSRCPSPELGESGILNTNEMAAMYIIM